MIEKTKKIIGRADRIGLPEVGLVDVPARIDTGAKTSAMWASSIKEQDGTLTFVFFAPSSPLYTGKPHATTQYEQVTVASSNGERQARFKVRLLVKIRGKKIRASFTLADRSKQAYPVLIGRNALRGKFLVDVESGKPDYGAEKQRHATLQQQQERE